MEQQNVNHTIDARRTARDGDKLSNFVITSAAPFVQFNAALWRQFAANCEQVARNYENAIGVLMGTTQETPPSQHQ